jgi:uncharacterized protein YjiS (DUF1127 family)
LALVKLKPAFRRRSRDRKHKPHRRSRRDVLETEMSYFTDLFRRAERKRALRDLLKLDDHLLRDIGLARADVCAMRRGRYPAGDHE